MFRFDLMVYCVAAMAAKLITIVCLDQMKSKPKFTFPTRRISILINTTIARATTKYPQKCSP